MSSCNGMCLNDLAIDKAATYLIDRSQERGQSAELCTATQILKIQEEAGEAAAELAGMLTAHTLQGAQARTPWLMDELCDVAITALVALSMVGGEQWPDHLAERITFCTDRLVKGAADA